MERDEPGLRMVQAPGEHSQATLLPLQASHSRGMRIGMRIHLCVSRQSLHFRTLRTTCASRRQLKRCQST
jgi:hypothetical protein